MGHQTVNQSKLVKQSKVNDKQAVEQMALFDEQGKPFTGRSLSYAAVVLAGATGTAGKTSTEAPPVVGSLVPLQFTNGNTAASPTVTFATGGAKPILLGGSAPAGAEITLAANGIALFYYDGASLHQVGVYS